MFYNLNKDGTVERVDDISKISHDNHIVCQTEICNRFISTVFLGLDHNFSGGQPILFETMVFPIVSGEINYSEEQCHRYETIEQAKIGHDNVVWDVIVGG